MSLYYASLNNIQQLVRVLRWPNEYRRSGAAVYGSYSTETPCPRGGAELLRLAQAIFRLSQTVALAFAK